jgi:tRNA(adenine34) deaminase
MSSKWMDKALEQAAAAGTRGEIPIGAVLVCKEKLIAVAGNRVEELCDPTAHAEMLVIREATKKANSPRLMDCNLYVTLEPCAMCAMALSFARINNLFFGAFDIKGGGVDHGPRIFEQPTCHHRPNVFGGLAEQPCVALLQDFFRERRTDPKGTTC